MISRFREQLGAASLVIAVCALVAALAGGAIAANGGPGNGEATASAKGKRGKPGKPGPAGPQGPAGPVGPQGPAGPAGANGKDGANGASGVDGEDGASVVTGNATIPGECAFGGATVEVEGQPATKKKVCNGQTGFTETLPPGKTETGAWAGRSSQFGSLILPISFTLPVIPPPTVVFVGQSEDKSAEGCDGIAADGLPLADPGKLCIYAASSINATFGASFTISENELNPGEKESPPGAGPAGTNLTFICGEEEAPGCFMNGAWAVTAVDE